MRSAGHKLQNWNQTEGDLRRETNRAGRGAKACESLSQRPTEDENREADFIELQDPKTPAAPGPPWPPGLPEERGEVLSIS